MHIGVAGNIGAGKTSLTRMLAEQYGWVPRFESVSDNPYLEDYYKDIPRWSFNLEMYFLVRRLEDLRAIAEGDQAIIQDRTIYEGVNVFVRNNYEMGNLSDRDFATYMEIFRTMTSVTKAPDLMIYLRCSVPHLVGQIQKRGRGYEQSISLEYLSGLNRLYEEWIAQYEHPLLVIEADDLDFVNNPDDFAKIKDRIDACLYGLF
ncbi:MAG: deoxynucleoside kinase [Bacteroidales bacterium]|nr:deoxynucleoside kinase [Candidatus Cryptobacteroides caccocaballi]